MRYAIVAGYTPFNCTVSAIGQVEQLRDKIFLHAI